MLAVLVIRNLEFLPKGRQFINILICFSTVQL